MCWRIGLSVNNVDGTVELRIFCFVFFSSMLDGVMERAPRGKERIS
jgi:hypothetical protein